MPRRSKAPDVPNRCRAGGASRRDFAKALGAAGLGLVTLPLAAKRAKAAADDLHIFEWAGYEIPELHPSYIEKHGGSPRVSLFGEEEEAFAKLMTGYAVDTCHPCTASVRKWYDAGLIDPIDTSRLDHWVDIFPSLKTLEGTTANGQNLLVPFDWGNSSVLYRTDLVEPGFLDNESWEILFDERYAGRLAMYDSVDAAMGVAGLVIGADNPFDMAAEELDRACTLLRKQRDLLRFYWTDRTQVQQALASGELVAAYAWNSEYWALKAGGQPVAYATPKEGIYTWVCGLVRVKAGVADEELVYDFLNAVTSPEAGEFLLNEYGIGHANMETMRRAPREQLDRLGIRDPVSHLANGVFFAEIAPEVRQKYIQAFEEIKAGL